MGKNILLGVSGGIAAYKSPLLIRELVKQGCNVKAVTTRNALQFVTPMTLQTLSNNPVYTNMFQSYQEETTKHISLAAWGDIFVVAPASADVIGKYANGIADDALTTSLLAFDRQVFVCPAMNDAMYKNAAVQKNLEVLRQRGVKIIDSEEGFLACGAVGKGRMAEVQTISDIILNFIGRSQNVNGDEQYADDRKKSVIGNNGNVNLLKRDFIGKKVTITAGPTREKIDSVRFISNNSSGRMGIALTDEFVSRGATVDLVLGPVSLHVEKNDLLKVINVESAEDMYLATLSSAKDSDIVVCAAAVADYTPKNQYEGKMKKHFDSLMLELTPTKDILAELGRRKTPTQILVGFALETDNEIDNATAKLNRKNLDFIVLNSLKDRGAGFEVPTNKVTVIKKDGSILPLPLKQKSDVASDIVNMIKEFF